MELQVFIASPSDVVAEREMVYVVCDELNKTLCKFLEVRLNVLDWLQVPPGCGNPQALIFKYLKPETWDIFIGIFWKRFGSPTGFSIKGSNKKYLSGTQQEFIYAYNQWKIHGKPHIMFYRRVGPLESLEDLDSKQYRLIEKFFKGFNPTTGDHPGFFRSYQKAEDFERKVRMDLALYLIDSNPILQRKLANMLPRNFLQVLLHHFSISYSAGNKTIIIELNKELDLVTDSEERNTFHANIRTNTVHRNKLKQRLIEISTRVTGRASIIDCDKWPMRYANGGVLPVLRMNGKRYFCLFYRETFPTGWNIANGGSDNYQELLNPERILLREFSKELLIVDEKEKAFYCFKPGMETIPASYQTAAIKAWGNRLNKPEYESYRVKNMPISKWIKGKDSVKIVMDGERSISKNFFLNITPDDNAIEVDRIAYINLDIDDNRILLDGEGLKVGRIIGLFEETSFLNELARAGDNKRNFYPELFFFDGERMIKKDLKSSIETFRSRLQLRSKYEVIKQKKRLTYQFDLCPITKAVTTKYAKWLRNT